MTLKWKRRGNKRRKAGKCKAAVAGKKSFHVDVRAYVIWNWL